MIAISNSGANFELVSGAAEKLSKLPVHATLTSNNTLTVDEFTPVNAVSAPITVLLPTGKSFGSLIAVEKSDETENIVTVSGSIRGEAATDTLKLKRETVVYQAESSGSWRPLADHKTLSSLDNRYPVKNTEGRIAESAVPLSVVNSRTAASFKPIGSYPLEAFESINKAIEEIHEKYGGGALIFPAGATNSEAGAINLLERVVLTGPPAEWSVMTEHPTAWLKAVAGTAPIINFPTTTVQAAVMNLGIVGGTTKRPGILLPEGIASERNGNRLRNVEVFGCGYPTETFEAAIEAGHLNELKGVTSFTGIVAGTVLQDAAHMIPAGVTVLSINEGAKTLVMSEPATEAHAMQKVEAFNPAVFIGQLETRMQDLLVFYSTGVGLIVQAQDCTLASDNAVGFSASHGVILGNESGPLRVSGSLDVYTNQGDGIQINGRVHRLNCIQSNGNQKRNLAFITTTGTYVMQYVGENASQAGAGEYPDTAFEHPTGSNTNCGIIGGRISCTDEKAKYGVLGAEHTISWPTLIGIGFTGPFSTGGSSESYVNKYPNFRVRGCAGVPDVMPSEKGLPALFVRPAGTAGQVSFYNKASSAIASGVANGGAFFGPFVAQSLKANGKVTISASEVNTASITLEANAESSEITNPTNGQQLTISWLQDATGSRTYAWPPNCRFAGGAAPAASITKGYTDSVTFIYSSSAELWKEISRAVAIH